MGPDDQHVRRGAREHRAGRIEQAVGADAQRPVRDECDRRGEQGRRGERAQHERERVDDDARAQHPSVEEPRGVEHEPGDRDDVATQAPGAAARGGQRHEDRPRDGDGGTDQVSAGDAFSEERDREPDDQYRL